MPTLFHSFNPFTPVRAPCRPAARASRELISRGRKFAASRLTAGEKKRQDILKTRGFPVGDFQGRYRSIARLILPSHE